MFGLEGIPGIYIHSLLGTGNDYEKVKNTSHTRSINRHKWDYTNLQEQLASPYSQQSKVHARMIKLLNIRKEQPAFHPNATQFTLQLGEQIFGFWRQSIDRRQSIFCIFNVTDEPQNVRLSDINLIGTDTWFDLISGHTMSLEDIEYQLTPYQSMWISNIGSESFNLVK